MIKHCQPISVRCIQILFLFFQRLIRHVLPLLAIGYCLVALCISPTWAKGNDSETLAPQGPPKELSPEPIHMKTHRAIVRELNYEHYHRIPIDDSLSKKMFDQYLEELDYQRSLFLSQDIKQLSEYQYLIDDALKRNDLSIGFKVFNLYQSRSYTRLKTLIKWLEGSLEDFDFSTNETLQTDRGEASWPNDTPSLEALWRKQLKHQILGLKLAEKPKDETLPTLKKRYENQLNRLLKNNSDDAFQTYINAVIQAYDPHTQYFSPSSSENFNINMSLSLEGIGAVLKTDGQYTKVVRLVAAGPAEKSQLLQPADRIIGVGQGKAEELVSVIGWRIDEVVELIRGPKGTLVRLEIIPADSPHSQQTDIIELKRDKVKLEEQAAKSEVLDIEHQQTKAKVGVIDIPTFYIDFKALREKDPNYRSTTRDVAVLIEELKQQEVDGIVIDLRNNGGGSLQEANSLLGLFIRSGPTVQIRNDRNRIEILKDRDKSITYTGPIVVMVNRLSASASEIFAAAVQDYQRGLVVGTATFGKGTVQALRPLDHGQLKITQAKFYRISGGSNQHKGVIPDILFPNLYDPTLIGESTHEHALPWDTIRPARHNTYGDIKPLLPALTSLHQQRVSEDPDFQYLISQLELSQSQQAAAKTITLNEKQRWVEQESLEQKRLSIENTLRKAKGLDVIKTAEELKLTLEKETEEEQAKAPKDRSISQKDNKPDAMLYEAAHILLDYTQQDNRIANRNQR